MTNDPGEFIRIFSQEITSPKSYFFSYSLAKYDWSYCKWFWYLNNNRVTIWTFQYCLRTGALTPKKGHAHGQLAGQGAPLKRASARKRLRPWPRRPSAWPNWRSPRGSSCCRKPKGGMAAGGWAAGKNMCFGIVVKVVEFFWGQNYPPGTVSPTYPQVWMIPSKTMPRSNWSGA